MVMEGCDANNEGGAGPVCGTVSGTSIINEPWLDEGLGLSFCLPFPLKGSCPGVVLPSLSESIISVGMSGVLTTLVGSPS